jgi:hypothetical protein
MDPVALAQITDKLKEELARWPPSVRAAIVGRTPAAVDLVAAFIAMGIQHQLLGRVVNYPPVSEPLCHLSIVLCFMDNERCCVMVCGTINGIGSKIFCPVVRGMSG